MQEGGNRGLHYAKQFPRHLTRYKLTEKPPNQQSDPLKSFNKIIIFRRTLV